MGGTFEKAALNSKKTLFREIGSPNPIPPSRPWSRSCSTAQTASASARRATAATRPARYIHLITNRGHITSLPVAVTIECHAHRHKEATL